MISDGIRLLLRLRLGNYANHVNHVNHVTCAMDAVYVEHCSSILFCISSAGWAKSKRFTSACNPCGRQMWASNVGRESFANDSGGPSAATAWPWPKLRIVEDSWGIKWINIEDHWSAWNCVEAFWIILAAWSTMCYRLPTRQASPIEWVHVRSSHS